MWLFLAPTAMIGGGVLEVWGYEHANPPQLPASEPLDRLSRTGLAYYGLTVGNHLKSI